LEKVEFAARVIDRNNASVKIPEANLNDSYAWKTVRNSSDADAVCPACEKFSGRVQSLENWLKTAIPGVAGGTTFNNKDVGIVKFNSPHGNPKYGTFCESACRCKLVRVGKTIKKK
jgi:hypothetical protein